MRALELDASVHIKEISKCSVWKIWQIEKKKRRFDNIRKTCNLVASQRKIVSADKCAYESKANFFTQIKENSPFIHSAFEFITSCLQQH